MNKKFSVEIKTKPIVVDVYKPSRLIGYEKSKTVSTFGIFDEVLKFFLVNKEEIKMKEM
jgi:hypothetical protein